MGRIDRENCRVIVAEYILGLSGGTLAEVHLDGDVCPNPGRDNAVDSMV
jgi:hypothetical protein